MEIHENKVTGKIFKYEYIECHGIYNITIHNPTDKNRPLGRCTVVRPLTPTAPIILDFVIYSQAHRRKKMGSDLMNFVKTLFGGGIKSSFYSKAGKEFAKKTGWKEVQTEKGSYLYFSDDKPPPIKLYDANNKEIQGGKEEMQELPINNRTKELKDAESNGEKVESTSKEEGVQGQEGG